jgi:predicted metalloprotease with PDZ domain
MYSLYSSEPYSSGAFEKVVGEIGGDAAADLLRSLLTTTADPDFDPALDWYGLELNRGALVITGEPGAELLRSDLGVLWEEDSPGLVVRVVLDGSGGSVAGLIPGDEILAIGDERLTRDNLDSLMTSFSPGEQAELLIARHDRIIRLDMKLDVAIPDHFEIVLKSDFERRDVSRLQSLLGQDPRK